MKNDWSSGGGDAGSSIYTNPPSCYRNDDYNSANNRDMGHPAYYIGHYEPHNATGGVMELRCNCAHNTPNNRTILHGILTGRGYKFGYPGATAAALLDAPFFASSHIGGYHNHHHHHAVDTPFYMGLEPIEAHTKGLSHGVTSHSRYISQPVAK